MLSIRVNFVRLNTTQMVGACALKISCEEIAHCHVIWTDRDGVDCIFDGLLRFLVFKQLLVCFSLELSCSSFPGW